MHKFGLLLTVGISYEIDFFRHADDLHIFPKINNKSTDRAVLPSSVETTDDMLF